MKKTLIIRKEIPLLFSISAFILILFISVTSCTNEQISDELLETIKGDSEVRISIPIQNPGFELGEVNWGDPDNYAISSEGKSGSKSGKVSSSSGTIEQTVDVSRNTDYVLKAWVKGNGELSVGGQSNDFDTDDFEEVFITFNSGSSSSVTILGTRISGDVRFDDFSLNSTLIDGPAAPGQIIPISVSANGNQTGYGPENTVDGEIENTESRWSSNGYTGKYITYDLGTIKTISSVKIAWFKGDEREAYFKIRVGNSTSSLTTVFDAKTIGSSGITEGLETFDFEDVDVRYVRISSFGNSKNSWNSIIETEIYGNDEDSDEDDTTPPGSVSELNAVAGNNSVALNWNNPRDSDLNNVRITYDGGEVTSFGESVTINNLINGTNYTFTVVAIDNSGNVSASKVINAIPHGPPPPGGTAASIIGPGWKLNGFTGSLNIGSNDNGLDYADNASKNESHFFFEKDGFAAFKCYPGNPTSGGSSNSRSELREVINGGDGYWNGNTNTEHSMKWKFKVENLPPSGKLAFGQIHEKDDFYDDVIRVQVQGDAGQSSGTVDLRILGYVTEKVEDREGRTIDFDMQLDTEYYFELTMSNGIVTLYDLDNNGNRVEELFQSIDIGNANENYFKAGCYLQSTNSSHESSDVYGQVLIKDLEVSPDN
ncbi:Fibronectin type III domain-containing protein [Aquimarina amphilecti]|uniref:Fibronectin type III domain-containing protein n=1 Tax=Aquimarina amphilecti TaxID=1038014 RepID=A0A1H7I4F0_AQUAM|nr:polysaccharide lyase family 7 protein [Aquimarina amphilecti]SEK57473.1 Fibronectin type III domain-containing protein [Aquimarina amphilecti]